MLTVNEIFHSIQGESTRAGEPCVFVRLTACDLRCSWCDTPYAFYEGQKTERSTRWSTRSTGYGCRTRRDHRRRAAAAGGRLPADGAAARDRTHGAARNRRHIGRSTACRATVVKIVDVKCPGSGESARTTGRTSIALAPHDEVKFVHRGSRRLRVRARRRRPPRPDGARARRCCSRRCTACSIRRRSRSGSSRTACRRACSCSCTSSSGHRTHGGCLTLAGGTMMTDRTDAPMPSCS